ncbi:MAG TPA: Rieske 2Fe-2S domain-containing protein [Chlamydiales bacterium]|nr:Rieske 2Fe-2S domain-containing protein [Chlamydiales bacterium]
MRPTLFLFIVRFMRVKIDPNELPVEGKGRSIVFKGGVEIALFCVQGAYYAIDNICPHEGGPLGEGELDGEIVSCPWHGWQFDVKNGKCQHLWDENVASYPVEVVDGEVFVTLPNRT